MGRAVFTDDSGGRAVALTWLGRGLVLASAALLCVLGVIVQTHVTVPPLERVWESGLRGAVGSWVLSVRRAMRPPRVRRRPTAR